MAELVDVNPLILPPDYKEIRKPRYLKRNHGRGTLEEFDLRQFDSRTVFYDVFFNKDGSKLRAIGPPFLNLARYLNKLQLTVNGLHTRYRIRSLPRGLIGLEAKLKQPANDSNTVEIAFEDCHWSRDISFLRANKPITLSLTTVQRDNKIPWILDWIRYYSKALGVDRFFIYDNRSEYQAQLIDLLPANVSVVPWNSPLGPTDSHPNKYLHTGQINHSRLRFEGVETFLNFDIDELLVIHDERVKELIKNKPAVRFRGYRVPYVIIDKKNYSYTDFFRRKPLPQKGAPKYSFKGTSISGNAVHRAIPKGIIPRIFRPLFCKKIPIDQAYFLHYNAINTDWKLKTSRPGSKKGSLHPWKDVNSLVEDLSVNNVLEADEQTPLISVIIPVFNTREHLPECLDSVLSQSFSELEIICVDDGSTDDSGDILHQYAEQDNRIKVLNQENRGASSAKNRGFALASGEFFTIVDSDDILLPGALLKLYSAINSEGADIIHGGYITRNERTGRRYLHLANRRVLTGPDALGALLKRSVHHDPWGKLFRRSLFIKNHLSWPESTRHATDFLIVHQAFHFARRVAVIPDLVYERTTSRPGSISHEFSNPAFVPDKLRARVETADFIRSRDQWELHREDVRRNNHRFFENAMLRRMMCYGKGKGHHSLRDIVGICKDRLPEFSLTDGEILRLIFRILNGNIRLLAAYSTTEQQQIVCYVDDYLRGLDLEAIDLPPKERRYARSFATTFLKRLDRSKSATWFDVHFYVTQFSKALRLLKQVSLYDKHSWKVALQWLLRRGHHRSRFLKNVTTHNQTGN